jgi:hypothetical protein
MVMESNKGKIYEDSSKFIIPKFDKTKTYEDHVGSWLQNLIEAKSKFKVLSNLIEAKRMKIDLNSKFLNLTKATYKKIYLSLEFKI